MSTTPTGAAGATPSDKASIRSAAALAEEVASGSPSNSSRDDPTRATKACAQGEGLLGLEGLNKERRTPPVRRVCRGNRGNRIN
eukprot:1183608-Prorocentrum_minimum.AAC.3